MLSKLKKLVCDANLLLPKYGLVTFTWGNVSAIDREKGLVVIKPSGVEYEHMKPEHMVVVDLEGNRVEGDMNPPATRPPTSSSTAASARWAASCTPIPAMPRPLRRRNATCPAWAPPTRTTSTAACR